MGADPPRRRACRRGPSRLGYPGSLGGFPASLLSMPVLSILCTYTPCLPLLCARAPPCPSRCRCLLGSPVPCSSSSPLCASFSFFSSGRTPAALCFLLCSRSHGESSAPTESAASVGGCGAAALSCTSPSSRCAVTVAPCRSSSSSSPPSSPSAARTLPASVRSIAPVCCTALYTITPIPRMIPCVAVLVPSAGCSCTVVPCVCMPCARAPLGSSCPASHSSRRSASILLLLLPCAGCYQTKRVGD